MHLRPINPADRPTTSVPPTGAGANGAAPSVSGVAVVRPVSPVADSQAGRAFDPSRTGVDLSALLRAGADQLVTREQPGAVELAAVLERARAALVRGDPGSTLAALDEAWDGAMRTEGGWYYRAAALSLLGLPGEADRVLSQALIPRAGSIALLFLQSVVRSGMGDTRGAREALASALARSPAEPVLRAWNAVLTARVGDRAGALQQLAAIPLGEQSSTLHAWARQAITSATVNAARAATPWNVPVVAAEPAAEPAVAATTALQRALQVVGNELAHGSLVDVRREVRTLLRSVTTGGAFDQSTRPESLAAVRSVLAAILGVIASEHDARNGTPFTARAAGARAFDARTDPDGRWHISADADDTIGHNSSASAGLRSALLLALRTGDFDLADSLLHKLPAGESASIVDALRHVSAGARGEARSSPLGTPVEARPLPLDTPVEGAVQSTFSRLADQLITPVRIGLSLLVAQSQRAEANSAVYGNVTDQLPPATDTMRNAADGSAAGQSSSFAATGLWPGVAAVPLDPASTTAAALAAGAGATVLPDVSRATGRALTPIGASDMNALSLTESFESGKRLRALALGCMALAFAAMIYGYGVAAIALAGGASWLALRSSAVDSAARRSAERDTSQGPGR